MTLAVEQRQAIAVPPARVFPLLCTEGKSVVWDGRWLGVPLRQEWFLEPRADGCRVILRSRFSGAGASLLRIFRLDRRWQRMLDEQARGLEKLAERL